MIIDNSVKLPRANKEGYCLGYKVIKEDNTSSYQGFEYKEGITKAGFFNKAMSKKEIANGKVCQGIHIFLHLENAIEEAKYWSIRCLHEKTIKVYFRKKDVIAIGYFKDRTSVENVVVKSILIKSLKEIGE
jgi:hypothetical protein